MIAEAEVIKRPPTGRVISKAFWTQYLSIIFIVPTFLIGILAGDKARKIESHHPVLQKPAPIHSPVVENKPIALEFDQIFERGSARLQSQQFEAIATILLSHDLDVVVSLFGDNEEGISLTLARSVVLYRAFLKRGVPATALKVLAFERDEPIQAKVNFIRSEQP